MTPKEKEIYEKTKKLNPKQLAFAHEYIKSRSALASAKAAGYSTSNARKYANQLLNKPHVRDYIALLMREAFTACAMSLEEALALTAAIARGEPKTLTYKRLNKLTGKVTIHREVTATPSIEEQQRSLEHVLRCAGAFNAKPEDNTQADGIERFKQAVSSTVSLAEVYADE